MRFVRRSFLFLSLAVAIACQAAKPTGETPMQDLVARSPACLGRFLIDLPAGLDTSVEDMYQWTKIEAVSMPLIAMREEVAAAEKKFASQKVFDTNAVALRSLVAGPVPNSNIALVGSGYTYDIYGYFWTDQTRFLIHDKAGNQDSKRDLAIANVNSIIANLRHRPDTEIPTTAGFCTDRGFVAGVPKPGEPHREETTRAFFLAQRPDILIRVVIRMNRSQTEGKLVDRINAAPVPAFLVNAFTGVKVFKKGEHPVGAIPAQEYSVRVPKEDKDLFPYYLFRWEAEGKPLALDVPRIVIEMQTGYDLKSGGQVAGAVPTSLSDDEALRLFHEIVDSVRLRPGAV